jgi:ribonucleoside-diphosphate reductase alpha chain
MADNETEFQEMIDKMRSDNFIIDEEIDRTEFLGSYSSYIGSPMYNGKLQFDLWELESKAKYPLRHDWDTLRSEIGKYGARNSLLVAPMPTASTSQILGNNECFEPFTTNIYIRRTLAGEFIVINNHLIHELIKLGIWNNKLKNRIIEANGSVQGIEEIPEHIKETFKTVWETSNKTLIDMAADRGRFICQSQSLNLFVEKPNFNNLSSMHMYSWKCGLKTGLYYLRTRPVAQAQKFTIEPGKKPENKPVLACSIDNPDCEACSA